MVTVVTLFPPIAPGVMIVSTTVKISSLSIASSLIILTTIHSVVPLLEPVENSRAEETAM